MTSIDTTTYTDDRELVAYAADVVAYRKALSEHEEIEILLIQRRWAPFVGQWALPGGHVDAEETSQAAAARELAEETGINVNVADLERVGIFDEPGRDPRGRVVSVAYVIEADPWAAPVAGDDAAAAKWVGLSEAFATGLAFDHDEVIRQALAKAFGAPAPTHEEVCSGCADPWCPVTHANETAAAAEDQDEDEFDVLVPDMAVRIFYTGGDDEVLRQLRDEQIAELTAAFTEGRPFTRPYGDGVRVYLPGQVTRFYVFDANLD
jgi:8-oxo-dGTP diphosphatase